MLIILANLVFEFSYLKTLMASCYKVVTRKNKILLKLTCGSLKPAFHYIWIICDN